MQARDNGLPSPAVYEIDLVLNLEMNRRPVRDAIVQL